MNTNKQNISFYNQSNGEITKELWAYLTIENIKSIDPLNFEYNIKKGLLKRNEWKPLIPNIIPIYEGMKMDESNKYYTDIHFNSYYREYNFKSFLEASHNYFGKYSNKKIAVQLSGGLDSSIIICLLSYFNIPFSLVGMTSSRYEFRTEKRIQEILAKKSSSVILIDYESHLPFSEMEKAPVSQLPDLSINNVSADLSMAKVCEELGVEILFSGFGGDVLFATEIPSKLSGCEWKPQLFYDSWLIDLVYKPHNVSLTPFYANPEIMNAIFNLRLGQKEDIQKKWARNFFKSILPPELVNYTYVADFWGLYISGLINNLESIQKMHQKAFEITLNPYFTYDNFHKKVLKADLYNSKKEIYQPIEARIAFTSWLYTLSNNKIL
jgi:hypothetical protein